MFFIPTKLLSGSTKSRISPSPPVGGASTTFSTLAVPGWSVTSSRCRRSGGRNGIRSEITFSSSTSTGTSRKATSRTWTSRGSCWNKETSRWPGSTSSPGSRRRSSWKYAGKRVRDGPVSADLHRSDPLMGEEPGKEAEACAFQIRMPSEGRCKLVVPSLASEEREAAWAIWGLQAGFCGGRRFRRPPPKASSEREAAEGPRNERLARVDGEVRPPGAVDEGVSDDPSVSDQLRLELSRSRGRVVEEFERPGAKLRQTERLAQEDAVRSRMCNRDDELPAGACCRLGEIAFPVCDKGERVVREHEIECLVRPRGRDADVEKGLDADGAVDAPHDLGARLVGEKGERVVREHEIECLVGPRGRDADVEKGLDADGAVDAPHDLGARLVGDDDRHAGPAGGGRKQVEAGDPGHPVDGPLERRCHLQGLEPLLQKLVDGPALVGRPEIGRAHV